MSTTPSWSWLHAAARYRGGSGELDRSGAARTVPDQVRTLYHTLEVSETASAEVIDAAWKALLRRWHPDVNPAPEAARMALKLNCAHEMLNKPASRALYDAQLARERQVCPESWSFANVSMSAGDASFVVWPPTHQPRNWRQS